MSGRHLFAVQVDYVKKYVDEPLSFFKRFFQMLSRDLTVCV